MTFFNFLDYLTKDKIHYTEISKEDWKCFDIFMINRYLSMNTDLIGLVNQLQTMTNTMTKEQVYRLYYGILPQQKFYFKYIKAKSKDNKYNEDLINLIRKYYHVSNTESNEYLDIYFKDEKGTEELKKLLIRFGIDNKVINKMLKFKKSAK